MTVDDKSGSMVSREITNVPKGDAEFRRWVEKNLRTQFKDIKALYSMTTDTDLFEQKQRDNLG